MKAGGDVPDLIEEESPLLRNLDLSPAVTHRAGKRTPNMAEELALEESFGEGGAVDCDERLVTIDGVVMNRACDELFTGSRFTANENRGRASRQHTDRLEDLTHLRRAAHDVVDAPFLGGFGHQVVELGVHLAHALRLADTQQKLVIVDGLADVLESAELHRLDRRLHVVERGNHDDVGLLVDLTDALQDVYPVHHRKMNVQDDEIRRDLLKLLDPFASVGSEGDVEALARQMSLERLANQSVVVNDENRFHASPITTAGSSACGIRRGS